MLAMISLFFLCFSPIAFYSALFCCFCYTLLHYWSMIHWFFCISLITVMHHASQLHCVDRCDLIAYMKCIQLMTHTDAIETYPTSVYPTIVHCLGFICSIYISILDEGYVLTQHLNPIDAFCVCPALRLISECSAHQSLSILTCFITWTSSPSGFTSLPLFSWLPPLAPQGQPAKAKVAKP